MATVPPLAFTPTSTKTCKPMMLLNVLAWVGFLPSMSTSDSTNSLCRRNSWIGGQTASCRRYCASQGSLQRPAAQLACWRRTRLVSCSTCAGSLPALLNSQFDARSFVSGHIRRRGSHIGRRINCAHQPDPSAAAAGQANVAACGTDATPASPMSRSFQPHSRHLHVCSICMHAHTSDRTGPAFAAG